MHGEVPTSCSYSLAAHPGGVVRPARLKASLALLGFTYNFREKSGGGDGIRTHDTLLGYTPLAGERLRPLGHTSTDGDSAYV